MIDMNDNTILRRLVTWGAAAELLDILSAASLAAGLGLVLFDGLRPHWLDLLVLLGLGVDLLALAVACRICAAGDAPPQTGRVRDPKVVGEIEAPAGYGAPA